MDSVNRLAEKPGACWAMRDGSKEIRPEMKSRTAADRGHVQLLIEDASDTRYDGFEAASTRPSDDRSATGHRLHRGDAEILLGSEDEGA